MAGFLPSSAAIAASASLPAFDASAQGAPPAPPVQVATPLAKRVTNWDEYTGRFEASEQVEVRARVSGFIESVHFRDGALVQKGDLLFTIDQRPYKLAVDVAQADVARAKAQVELAQMEYTYPRLARMWGHLERIHGSGAGMGIGTRGPGETQLETDRRLVRKRVSALKDDIRKVQERKTREVAQPGE